MDPHTDEPFDPSLGLSMQEVARLTPEEYRRYRAAQRSYEEARKRRSEPNPPHPLDLGAALVMHKDEFKFDQMKRRTERVEAKERRRNERNDVKRLQAVERERRNADLKDFLNSGLSVADYRRSK